MARSIDPVATVAALEAIDFGSCPATKAPEIARRMKQLRGWLDAYEAGYTNWVNAHYAGGAGAPAADLHARDQGISSNEARKRERRAGAVKDAPLFGEALAAGEIAAEHADALANATCKLDEATKAELLTREADLLRHASNNSPERFARHCRNELDRIRRRHGIELARRQREAMHLTKKRDDVTGMYVLRAELDPDTGARVFNAIDAEVAALVARHGDRTADRSKLAAVALANLIAGGHQAARPGVAEIGLIVDERTLCDGAAHQDTVCELTDGTPVPVETAQRVACDAHIVPVVVSADGNVLNVGRTQRLANRQQRVALRALYRTCAFSECDVPFARCEIHHLHEWERGGRTDLSNLLPICSHHHHLVHEGGWQLQLDPDRTLTIVQPDGHVFRVVAFDTCRRRTEHQSDVALTA